MPDWSFLTNHARALVSIAHDPGIRLRDIATALGITERSAYRIVTDLATAGYIVKERDGRRNRYQIQEHLPLPGPSNGERTIGEVLDLLVESGARQAPERAASHTSPLTLEPFQNRSDTYGERTPQKTREPCSTRIAPRPNRHSALRTPTRSCRASSPVRSRRSMRCSPSSNDSASWRQASTPCSWRSHTRGSVGNGIVPTPA